mgnify:FL=1
MDGHEEAHNERAGRRRGLRAQDERDLPLPLDRGASSVPVRDESLSGRYPVSLGPT